MRTLILICLVVALSFASTAHAQGMITVVNRAFGVLDAPVFDVDCVTPLAGAAYMAQGYVGFSAESLEPAGSPAIFRELPGQEGYIYFQEITVEGFDVRHFQLRAWEASAGNSYEEAVTTGGKHGFSNIILVQPGNPPGPSAIPDNLESFCLVPEPGVMLLLGCGAVVLLARGRMGRCRK